MADTYPTADKVAEHHAVVERAIHLYYTENEVRAERKERICEADAASAVMVLASIKAAPQSNYRCRCNTKSREATFVKASHTVPKQGIVRVVHKPA